MEAFSDFDGLCQLLFKKRVFLETQAHLIHSQHNPYVLDAENIMEEGTGRF